ncbi:endonuclease [Actinomycetospora sp. CA-101289]|uniref:endonuclease n=1 Tax=Actinomycetospora sp. CA-101289 TaxID=3239893 RepID=UPI003D96F565
MSTIDALLESAGQTFADEAGIALEDEPAPLYLLLVLSVLLSRRVQAQLGLRACRELIDSGMGTPERMRDASWEERIQALGRAKYRSTEQTATALGEGAQLVLDERGGDLRRMREAADGDADRLRGFLTTVPRLGPVGADIFTREVQAVWPEFRPHLDAKALAGAGKLGLPQDPQELAGQVAGDDLARLDAALVRADRDDDFREEVERDDQL